jgi:predicted nuclease of restriction endonuclease-like (RecB) superfamily
MRAFFLAWTEEMEGLSQPVTELCYANLSQLVTEIPWGHNIVLFQKVKDPVKRVWYARETVKHGWSRTMLTHEIESELYGRVGIAVTNFDATLPLAQSNMAVQIIKDPYNFDFLSLGTEARERELEQALLEQIRQFLLELGSGFAFVGQQVHLQIGNEDYYIDLLFYHLKLRCYIVIDLKVVDFEPEFAGKMNFYLSAVDDTLRHPEDRATIGIIICKTRNKTIAEYALRDIGKPMGVARYILSSLDSLPDDYRKLLPSREELEKEIEKISSSKDN